MGWSWSLLLCQSAVRHAISSANIPTSLTVLDGLPAVVVKGADVAVAGYVDNVWTIGTDKPSTGKLLGDIRQ
eukprot:8241340-Pyramimonas_sp.AAC.1